MKVTTVVKLSPGGTFVGSKVKSTVGGEFRGTVVAVGCGTKGAVVGVDSPQAEPNANNATTTSEVAMDITLTIALGIIASKWRTVQSMKTSECHRDGRAQ